MVLPTNLGGRSVFCSAECLCNGEQWRALLPRAVAEAGVVGAKVASSSTLPLLAAA